MQISDSPGCLRGGTISLHRTKGAGKATLDALAGVEGDDASATRHQIHQSLESRFYSVEIFIDIGVIKFNRSQDYRVGKVMQELRPLVEESRVVLIAFADELFALSQLKTAAKVFRHSADQERRLQSRCMKNPCKHG